MGTELPPSTAPSGAVVGRLRRNFFIIRRNPPAVQVEWRAVAAPVGSLGVRRAVRQPCRMTVPGTRQMT
jgi:hypothetical protein